MRLELRKAVRGDWLGRPVYQLEVRLVVSDVEAEAIQMFRLEEIELWASPTALAFDAEAQSALARGSIVPLGGWRTLAGNIGINLRGLWVARLGDREARVTVVDVINGVAFEADELGELSITEQGLRGGFTAFVERFRVLVGYADGSVEIIEDKKSNQGIGPRGWVRMAR